MKIIQFEPRYRDDLIFMILEAKNQFQSRLGACGCVRR